MATGILVVSVATGAPLDMFDGYNAEEQADGYVNAINRAAGGTLARTVELDRNPRWSPRTSPEKVLDAIRRALRPNRPARTDWRLIG